MTLATTLAATLAAPLAHPVLPAIPVISAASRRAPTAPGDSPPRPRLPALVTASVLAAPTPSPLAPLAPPPGRSGFAGLPSEARPREKLLARGPAALADSELLAVLLRTGLPGRPVVRLAQELLERVGGFAGLMRADASALGAVKGLGLGPAKRTALLAVLEIARRALRQPLAESSVFENAETVRTYLRLQYDALPAECFAVMFLDVRHRLLALETLFHGTLSHTIAYPREVVTRALAWKAAAVILVHNHPSGHAEPSPQDIQLTRAMMAALALVEVQVLDHFIVGAGTVTSLTDLGYL